MLPFISIESAHDLEATAEFLEERNHWIETAHDRSYQRKDHNGVGSELAHI
jgi:hypothetical protein